MKSESKGSRFVRYFGPIIEVLKANKGSASAGQVRSGIAKRLAMTEAELNERLSSGSSRFDNQVAWARLYLARAGLLDSSRRGIWTLTEKGWAASLTDTASLALFRDIQRQELDRHRHAAGSPRTSSFQS